MRVWSPETWLDRLYGRKRQRSINAGGLYHLDGRNRADFAIRFERMQQDLDEFCRHLGLPPARLPEQKFKSGHRAALDSWRELFDSATSFTGNASGRSKPSAAPSTAANPSGDRT